ncbi:MAG: IS5 family transposase [Gemmatimonadetes bacterium]|nr:IS5 family transposase [Gemmatimonadota bacterium]
MRGAESGQAVLFSYVALEERIPQDHPLRALKALLEPVLAELSPRFETIYEADGRPSIPPEQLIRALLLQVLYTIRSERQLIEDLKYNLLYRWFVGLGLDAPVWHATTFTKNRDRLLAGDIAEGVLQGVMRQAKARGLLSHEHFTVDGTLLEAWASQKSFQPQKQPPAPPPGADGGSDRNPSVSFRGEKRTNATHASTSDPNARLAKKGKGKEAKLAYQASVTMDNRYGLVVRTRVGPADGGVTEIEQATEMLTDLASARPRRRYRGTVGGDKGYAKPTFLQAARALGFTPHTAQEDTDRIQVLDARTTRHSGYAVSQQRRKAVEESFGWGKVIGPLRKLKHRGTGLVDWIFTFTMAVYDLVRIRTLSRVAVCT